MGVNALHLPPASQLDSTNGHLCLHPGSTSFQLKQGAMKVLIRLIYLLAAGLFGFGLYLAFTRDRPDDRIRGEISSATWPTATGQASPLIPTGRADPGEASPAKPHPWLSDPNHGKESLRRFLATKRPDHEEMRAIANQIRVRIRFSQLYDLLGLDQAGIARFESAAAKAGLIFSELIGTTEESLQEHEQAQARLMDKVVSETLGQEYMPAFRAYLQTSDLRLMAAELAVNSFHTNAPLTASQAEQFIRISLENRTSIKQGPRVDPATIDWDAVAGRAGEILTPAQLQSLQAMIARRQFDREFKDVTGLPLRRPVRGL